MKKRIDLLMMMAVMVLALCACENQDIGRANTAGSNTEQMESAQKALPETDKTSGLELRNLLDEINTDIQPGTTGSYMTAVRVASHLLNWGVGTDMGTEEIKKEVMEWLSDKGNDEQVNFSRKLASVYEAYQQLLGPDAEELLESAGCQDTGYPWSDLPVETIEAIIEIVQLPEEDTEPVELETPESEHSEGMGTGTSEESAGEEQTSVPESETYPGADVVEIVNLRGDTATVYKLVDGRYMDRTNSIFIFDGTDTWTDENGVKWSEAVKYWNEQMEQDEAGSVTNHDGAGQKIRDPYDLYSWDSDINSYIPYQQADGNAQPIGRGNGWYYYDEDSGNYLPW